MKKNYKLKSFTTVCMLMIMTSSMSLAVTQGSLENFIKNKEYTGNFTDVATNSWYYENVKTAYEYGLVNGMSEYSFNPTGNITVAETITLASRLHSTYMNSNNVFSTTMPWYQTYVDYAIENGIIKRGQFEDYNMKATRAQFAIVFAKALPDEALNEINDIISIPDVSKKAFYADDVYKLYRAGILSGSDSYGTFNPNSNIQRSEVAAMVTRMADSNLRKKFILDMKISKENILGVWGHDGVIEWVFNDDNTFSYSLDREDYYIYELGTYSMNGNEVTLNYTNDFYWDESVGYKIYPPDENKVITIDKLNSTTMHFEPFRYDVYRIEEDKITQKLNKHFSNIENNNNEKKKEGPADTKYEVTLLVVELVDEMEIGATHALAAKRYVDIDMKDAISYAYDSSIAMLDAMQILKEIIDLCGEYEDMQEVKEMAQEIYDAMNECDHDSDITSSNCYKIAKKYDATYEETYDYLMEMIELENEWFE